MYWVYVKYKHIFTCRLGSSPQDTSLCIYKYFHIWKTEIQKHCDPKYFGQGMFNLYFVMTAQQT
jgi:hypothetical protein